MRHDSRSPQRIDQLLPLRSLVRESGIEFNEWPQNVLIHAR